MGGYSVCSEGYGRSYQHHQCMVSSSAFGSHINCITQPTKLNKWISHGCCRWQTGWQADWRTGWQAGNSSHADNLRRTNFTNWAKAYTTTAAARWTCRGTLLRDCGAAHSTCSVASPTENNVECSTHTAHVPWPVPLRIMSSVAHTQHIFHGQSHWE